MKPIKPRVREHYQLYLDDLEKSQDKAQALDKIIKAEKGTIGNIIVIILDVLLLALLIVAQINGYFNRDNIVIDYRGQVKEVNGQPYQGIAINLTEYQAKQGKAPDGSNLNKINLGVLN